MEEDYRDMACDELRESIGKIQKRMDNMTPEAFKDFLEQAMDTLVNKIGMPTYRVPISPRFTLTSQSASTPVVVIFTPLVIATARTNLATTLPVPVN